MNKRELSMYKLKDIVTELLEGTAIKKIARVRKVSKNTIKRYLRLLDTIVESQPDIQNDILETPPQGGMAISGFHKKKVFDSLKLVGIADIADKPYNQLSGGQWHRKRRFYS